MFKELLCDRTFYGKPLPPNIRVLAACNPHRRRGAVDAAVYGDVGLAPTVMDGAADVAPESVLAYQVCSGSQNLSRRQFGIAFSSVVLC